MSTLFEYRVAAYEDVVVAITDLQLTPADPPPATVDRLRAAYARARLWASADTRDALAATQHAFEALRRAAIENREGSTPVQNAQQSLQRAIDTTEACMRTDLRP